MKKTLYKSKALGYMLFALMFMVLSCRKDRFNPSNFNQSDAQKQLVKQEIIANWFKTNPAAKLITPDWSKAKQAVINGKNVVRVPTLNVDKSYLLKPKSSHSLNGINSSALNNKKVAEAPQSPSVSVSNNYYTEHPPELYFIQDDKSPKLYSYLLNFVPADKTKEFGENGIWTGELYEWNLTGDTVLIQNISKSKLTEKYAIKMPAQIVNNGQKNAIQSITKVNDHNSEKTSSLISEIWDALADFVGWVGSLFGLSEHCTFYGGDTGWRLNIDFDWVTDIFDGSGGGGNSYGGADGSYTGAGDGIYWGYLPGYYGDNYYTPYSDPSYNPYEPYPIHGGPNEPLDALTPADYLIEQINVADPNIISFLYQRQDIAQALREYLSSNGETTENKEFANWTAGYLKDNSSETVEAVLYNRTEYDNSDGDLNNNVDGGYDNTVYGDFDPQQNPWPSISSIIPVEQFVGWGASGVRRNCMDYAKAQIALLGYQISNYDAPFQTIQVFTEQNGVNNSELSKGLNYLKYALSNKIPVIIGVDDAPGNPGNADKTTDHFIVIVGMGTDSKGNYFRFYDNADNEILKGTSALNRLYYDSVTGKISGHSEADFAKGKNYTITQIRKSKKK